jgi:hypothetical protein
MSGTSLSTESARRALAAAEARAAASAVSGHPLEPLDHLRRAVTEGHLTISLVLARLATDGRDAELAALASAELSISFPVAWAMLGARLDKPAAILVRALDGDRQALQAVVAMRRSRALGTGGAAAFVFGQIDEAEALVLTRLIDRQQTEPDQALPTSPQRAGLALVG